MGWFEIPLILCNFPIGCINYKVIGYLNRKNKFLYRTISILQVLHFSSTSVFILQLKNNTKGNPKSVHKIPKGLCFIYKTLHYHKMAQSLQQKNHFGSPHKTKHNVLLVTWKPQTKAEAVQACPAKFGFRIYCHIHYTIIQEIVIGNNKICSMNRSPRLGIGIYKSKIAILITKPATQLTSYTLHSSLWCHPSLHLWSLHDGLHQLQLVLQCL
jgi:hypothetical protein